MLARRWLGAYFSEWRSIPGQQAIGRAYFNEHGRRCDRDADAHTHPMTSPSFPVAPLSRGQYVRRLPDAAAGLTDSLTVIYDTRFTWPDPSTAPSPLCLSHALMRAL